MQSLGTPKPSWRGLDFTPALMTLVLAFVVIGTSQFVHNLPGGERGLLLFEKACPLAR
jgi:hypothetical protein